jgi:hypothetical protein
MTNCFQNVFLRRKSRQKISYVTITRDFRALYWWGIVSTAK